MNELLKLLEKDCSLSSADLAAMLKKEEGELKSMIEKLEEDKVILGYQALIDWDKTDREYVSALIELKITPHPNRGFDKVAERIYSYPEVKSLYLMSGGFDLCVMLEGKTMREVAFFVAEKLAPMEDIVSTSTHFVLKKYKDKGIVYDSDDTDKRSNIL